MKTIVLTFILNLMTLSANAQAIDLLNCSSGGFAYNDLYIVDDGTQLTFKTDGIQLFLDLPEVTNHNDVIEVEFSIAKEKCDLSNIDKNELTCFTGSSPLTLSILQKDSMEKVPKTLKKEMPYMTLILKDVPNESSGLKLILMQSMVRDQLVLSNKFRYCLP